MFEKILFKIKCVSCISLSSCGSVLSLLVNYCRWISVQTCFMLLLIIFINDPSGIVKRPKSLLLKTCMCIEKHDCFRLYYSYNRLLCINS